MATEVIHEHQGDTGNNYGFVFGVVLLLLFMLLFFYYLLPALRGAGNPQINVPGQIDVNVNQP